MTNPTPTEEARLRYRSRWFRYGSLGLIILSCLGAAIALGGIHRETIVATSAITIVALALALWNSKKIVVDAMGWLLLAMVLYTALQLVPLPMAWLETLSPASADIWDSARNALGQPTGLRAPISVSPPSTVLGLLGLMGITAAYLTGWHLSRHPKLAKTLLLAIPVMGIAIVMIGVAHAIVGTTKVLGIYEPTRDMSTAVFFSSFVNDNHLAAFLNLGTPIALAQASLMDSAERKTTWGFVFLILAAATVFTLSRAGIITLILAIAIVMAKQPRRKLTFVVVGAVATFLGVAIWGPLNQQITHMIGAEHWLKIVDLRAPELGWLTAGEWPWTGCGRGAFEVASTRLNSQWPDVTLSHAHNTPLQVLSEYGWIIGGFILACGTTLIVSGFWRKRNQPLLRAAAAGLIAVGLHNLIDFNLDMPALALTAALMVGIVRFDDTREGKTTAFAPAALLGIAVLVGSLGFVVAPEAGPRRDKQFEGDQAHHLATNPSDYYAFLRAGIEHKNIDYLRHAHALHHADPMTMMALAALTDRDESLTLLQRVLQLNWNRHPGVFVVLDSLQPTPKEIVRVLPDGPHSLAVYLQSGTPSDTTVRYALNEYREDPEILLVVGQMAISNGMLTKAEDLAMRLTTLGAKTGYRLLGQVYARRKKHVYAYHMYLEAGDAHSMIDAADQAIKAGRVEDALVVIQTTRIPVQLLGRASKIQKRAEKALRERRSIH
jgi:hypothetical protein